MPRASEKSSQLSQRGRSRGQNDSDQHGRASGRLSRGGGHGSSQPVNQSQNALANFDEDEVERRVNDLVQYILIMDQKKLPIKKLDMNKHVVKELSKVFPAIIAQATEHLKRVFGYELIELEEKGKGSYILVSSLELEYPHIHWPKEDNSKMALQMVILSLIFMNGNVMQDTLMWHTLKKIGVDHELHHEVFGDVKKLITQEFVRNGYIAYIKQPNTEPVLFEFKWGQRALHETSKKNVLDFVSQIYAMKPEQWTSQFQDVQRSSPEINGDAEM